ncbi:TraA family conjugative transfer protein [Rhodoferax antarcticus]|uniref:Putative membrane protein n=1 Tax=Rhodoferax antarcticus ANT.BR TaxID=1111071 RepID=A0A1Q8Y9A7_9BURK|nr:TraA family conjugative transfer protein [Rhodoferax antarcticus]OLP04527.1 putative membrane protein [Rhodoferax antarcticus ANT.BR]
MKSIKSSTLTALVIFAALAASAIAGTDTTFGTATTGPLGTLTGWMTGSMGQLFAIGALSVGLGVGIVKQSIMAVVIGIAVALAASTGPTVLAAIFTAVL